MTFNNNLQEALIDVRKAYRLLADYQQRILELLDFMRERFEAEYDTHMYHNEAPKKFPPNFVFEHEVGRKCLPFLDITFFWIRPTNKEEDYIKRHTSGDILISVLINSDRGFTEDDVSEESKNYAEHSESILDIFLILCDEPRTEECNWRSVWNEFGYPEYDVVVSEEEVPGYRAYFNKIPLIKLASKEAVEREVDAFVERAGEKFGRDLTLVKSKSAEERSLDQMPAQLV